MFRHARSGRLLVILALLSGPPVRAWSQDFRPPRAEDGRVSLGPSYKPAVPEGLTTPEHLRFESEYQAGPRCGPNSLYILLNLCRKAVPYADVLARVPVGERGSNLDDLRKAAASFGLASEVRKLNPEDLRNTPFPVLVHLYARGERDRNDHFLVLTEFVKDDGTLKGIDSMSGQLTTWSPGFIARNFSGYCLIPTGRSPVVNRFLLANVLVLAGLNLWTARLVRKKADVVEDPASP